MNICILCENSKIEAARKTGQMIMGTKDVLKIGLSKSGYEPATHWFCFVTVTDEGYKMLTNTEDKNCIIEESNPKEFLNKWNLRIIK